MPPAAPAENVTDDAVAAIERLKHEYCYAIDDGRYGDWADCFAPDGTFVMDDGTTFEGRDELEAFGRDVFDDAYVESAHTVTNAVVDVDGDTATGRWYLALYHETADGDSAVQQASYADEFRRVDGEWRIAEANVTYGVRLPR
ncbi:bile acid 7-alpha dehydratase BaiE [Halarchaeum acidiphilum MH1-52-1]|uniref:Bile acid 7-alpha dehydratase BaiE n=1 Tax=Halarchaeum acidiphilum MH1-52-1 TaxID=1261545 RepID=U2YX27_9EURY|nr:bile acid 7-alpha dehydratase BaiE [Halarchaeum acidiphilum MH1-52-1]